MISQNPLTWSLTGPDPDNPGHPQITVGTNDPRWDKLDRILTLQSEAAGISQGLHDRYMDALRNLQIEIDAGRPLPEIPHKPKMVVVDDFGLSHEIEFVPPLPDPVPAPKPTPNIGIVNQTNRPSDPETLLQRIAADTAAIRAKVNA